MKQFNITLILLVVCSLVESFIPQIVRRTSNYVRLAASAEKKPWELFRFITQSSKFVKPPSLPFTRQKGLKRKVLPGEVIWSPSSSNNFFTFSPLDDVVMGGASSSTIDNNTGIWGGTVTEANNGGFVGIRSTPFRDNISLDMSSCEGIKLRIRQGNGRRFKFVTRDSTDFNGICWATEFDAVKNTESTIRIPFAKQVPTIFAKTVSRKTYDNTNTVGFQLAYSKFAYDEELNNNFELGEFSLQITELKSY